MHEDVGNLEIPMNDVFFSQVIKTVKDVFNDGFSSVLIEVAIFSETGLKITFIAELSDDITVPIAGENLKAS